MQKVRVVSGCGNLSTYVGMEIIQCCIILGGSYLKVMVFEAIANKAKCPATKFIYCIM